MSDRPSAASLLPTALLAGVVVMGYLSLRERIMDNREQTIMLQTEVFDLRQRISADKPAAPKAGARKPVVPLETTAGQVSWRLPNDLSDPKAVNDYVMQVGKRFNEVFETVDKDRQFPKSRAILVVARLGETKAQGLEYLKGPTDEAAAKALLDALRATELPPPSPPVARQLESPFRFYFRTQ